MSETNSHTHSFSPQIFQFPLVTPPGIKLKGKNSVICHTEGGRYTENEEMCPLFCVTLQQQFNLLVEGLSPSSENKTVRILGF